MKSNEHKDEVEIPIMRYALDIIKKWQFNFPILKYVTGKSGYNVKIRKLLDQIDREVKVFDKDSFDNIYNALYTMGSSKLCSSAVKHNSSLILKDRFIFMCAAYKQLNVIEK